MENLPQDIVLPLLCETLEIVKNADSGRNHRDVKQRLMNLIDNAKSELGHKKDWQHFSYALISWIDSEMHGVYQGDWREKPLEVEYFNMGEAHAKFFDGAERAFNKGFHEAYEMYFLSVMFGFRGVYQSGNPHVANGQPDSIEGWHRIAAKRLSEVRRKTGGRWSETRNLKGDRRPLNGKSSLVNSLIIFAGTLLAATIFFLIRFSQS